MLNLNSFKKLDKHQFFLQKKCKTDDIFLVWWCIRDLILNTEKKLDDIDLTMVGEPNIIYKKIDKSWLSHFITEKFGTITLIPKNKKVQYELTPLRTENEYSDNRHPEKINWQDDILLDSNRRDFTINSIYYFSKKTEKLLLNSKKQSKKFKTMDDFFKILKNKWTLFYQDQNLLIIQDPKYIWKLFNNWKLDQEFCMYLLDTIQDIFLKQKKSSEKVIRIILDPHKWLQDIYEKKLQSVWDPDKRFQEDALRILRALRFVSVLNQKLKDIAKNKDKIILFDIQWDTRSSLKNHKDSIKNISKERIKDELSKVFKFWDPFAFVSLLDEVGLLQEIFPSLYLTKWVEQPVRYHPFDTYVHTLLSLYELQKINKNYLVRLAMLYHDVWKVWQYWAYKEWISREEIREILSWPLNHRNSWPEIVKKDFSNLWFSKNEIKEISWYVAKHHVPWEILDAKDDNRLKKIRKLYSEADFEKANNLMDITISDRLWQYNPMQNSWDISDIEELRILLKKLKKEEWQFTSKDLKVDGKIIIDHFKIPAGPKIWELLQQALNWVMSDIKNRNNKEDILSYLKWFTKNK